MNILTVQKYVLVTLLSFLAFNASAQDPILDISFDGSAVDNSVNSAKIQGPVRFGTDRFGEEGRSAIFHPNHYDDLIVEPGLADIQISGPLTYSVWVNTAIDNTTKYVFTSSDSSRFHAGVTLVIDVNGRVAIQISDGFGGGRQNRNTYTSAGTITSNEWTNITFTIEQDGGANIFIDGVPQSVGAPEGGNTSNTIRHNVGPFKIGQKWEFFFIGGVDDLKLYDRILTLQEIVDLSNNVTSTITPSTSLIGVYPTAARDFITIDVEKKIAKEDLSIINASGQVYSFKMIGDSTIDVSNLPTGQYFICLTNEDVSLVSQFSKI